MDQRKARGDSRARAWLAIAVGAAALWWGSQDGVRAVLEASSPRAAAIGRASSAEDPPEVDGRRGVSPPGALEHYEQECISYDPSEFPEVEDTPVAVFDIPDFDPRSAALIDVIKCVGRIVPPYPECGTPSSVVLHMRPGQIVADACRTAGAGGRVHLTLFR